MQVVHTVARDKVVAEISSVGKRSSVVGCTLRFGVATILGVCLCVLGACGFRTEPPSWDEGPPLDVEMTRNFLDQRSDFERLLDGYTEADLEKLGIVDAHLDWLSGSTGLFITWYQGWFGGSHKKGYCYSREPLETGRDEGSVGESCRHIEGDWYVYEFLDP